MFSDRLVVETRSFRYMVEYKRKENRLLLTVPCIQEGTLYAVYRQLDHMLYEIKSALLEVERNENFGLHHCFEPLSGLPAEFDWYELAIHKPPGSIPSDLHADEKHIDLSRYSAPLTHAW